MEHFLETLHSSSFYEFSALLVLAAIAGMIGALLRQPLVIAFIIIGVLAGPSAFAIVTSDNEINLLAKLGISILLFIVGLKLDLGLIKKLGGTAALIASVQMFFTVAIGFGLCLALGIDTQTALLIGVALAFSSTIIIIKMLSDKREIDSLHGRIALGVLIVQDLAVVLAMIVLATLSAGQSPTGAETSLTESLLRVGVSSIILLSVLALFMRTSAEKVASFAAQNQELLICFAIAWAVFLAALCDMLGLSKELGGLLAGITLASTPYRENIISRLASLRDFLLLFFFISLGMKVDIGTIEGALIPAIALSIFVILFKPFIIMTLSGFLGYRKRTGFLAGISLAQISEFSMIFAAMAYASGFLTQEGLSIITLTGIITILTSTYLLALSEHLYRITEPALDIFERKAAIRQEKAETRKLQKDVEIIMFGLGRYGRAMAKGFKAAGKEILVVDFNPEQVKRSKRQGLNVIFGDAHDTEFLHKLPLKKAKWVISALPQRGPGILHEDPREVIIQGLKDTDYKGKTAIAVHSEEGAKKFKKLGTDVIFQPFEDASHQAVETVLEYKPEKPKAKPKAKKKLTKKKK